MPEQSGPESSAVRVALWRALHLQVDPPPHILEDSIGLELVHPEKGWKDRPDMHPEGTKGYRLSIVTRARFIEDLVIEKQKQGVTQYVQLGAGLDTFTQRNPDIASKMNIFEIDQPLPQSWKQKRLVELGFGNPNWLHFVPVDFESGESWWDKLMKSGFDVSKPAIITSTGVSMYLTREANLNTLQQITRMAPGSTLAMTFILPLDLLDPKERPQHEMVYERAKVAGTPFISFFRPQEAMDLAREAGFGEASHVSREDLIERYFKNRNDGLLPGSGEEFLIARI